MTYLSSLVPQCILRAVCTISSLTFSAHREQTVVLMLLIWRGSLWHRWTFPQNILKYLHEMKAWGKIHIKPAKLFDYLCHQQSFFMFPYVVHYSSEHIFALNILYFCSVSNVSACVRFPLCCLVNKKQVQQSSYDLKKF